MNYFKCLVITCLMFCASRPVIGFDHDYVAWNRVLAKYVQAGKVDYGQLKSGGKDLDLFLQDVANLTQNDLDGFTTVEKLAFWINVYNATTVRLVVENYPPQRAFGWRALKFPAHSLMQVSDVFDLDAGLVAGKKLSLNTIEHEILRQQFREPRIHFALVCAARSCPPIRSEAYLPEKLEQQLADQSYIFLNDPYKNYYTVADKTLHLSQIFNWFGVDFTPPGVPEFVRFYLPESLQSIIHAGTRVEWLPYDWTLNDTHVN